ncbi:hypothetical protein MKW92_050097 [Papaver armeniacum]|nr:hypothetical protein MKW92_050097 [Papaver armeniacum]
MYVHQLFDKMRHWNRSVCLTNKYILTQGDFPPSRVNSTSHLKIIQQIERGFNYGGEYLEIFKKTSVGHLLDMNGSKFSGATVNSMLRRMLEPLEGDDPDSMYFRIGGKVIKYGKRESALMTGLSFKGSDVIPPHGRVNYAGSDLIGKYFPGKRSIKLEELSRKFDSIEQSMDKVKLGLVLLVQGVLIGADYPHEVNLAYFSMVENIEKFNTFPCGKLCHRRMLKCFRTAVSGKNESKAAIITHKLYGFPYAFQVWAFESIPLLRKTFAKRSESKHFPRVLHFSLNSMVPESFAVENILTSKKRERWR